MPNFRISEAAALLGVSDDTVRRWADQGRLPVQKSAGGRLTVDGRELAAFAQSLADAPEPGHTIGASARNRLRGIVTRVTKDGLMAQVEIQAGPFRVVSLMSREAADELALEVGVVAVASVKSTHVVVELPEV
ncbi:helix-turn-helix domain-containing protein [Solihabitans fulvus]|uniref:Helix-turn-helix domain-containing protein n=1 Tax=Solihabitans fulvus TaxID=1892852 RepID=A0A5B2XQE8_9PSEU|nr:helix-turn-helix transcriptional regulator [Solihabitans fulvus]KAA2266158.1 helix-turn-helix domain-containing protein [Solihabitans fulvus]